MMGPAALLCVASLVPAVAGIALCILVTFTAFGILGVVFYYQIFNLQISNYSEYEIAAENNKNEEISVQPLRGIIFDRNGEILVNNIPTFDLITKPFFIDDTYAFSNM